MRQLTVRGFEPELERRLRDLAKSEGVSLNRAALTLMRQGAGLSHPGEARGTVGSDLDTFVGVWSAEEVEEFERALAPFEQVDPELWS